MAVKRRRRKDSSFTPALVVLNLLIIGVIALMIFFIYRFINSEETAPPERTTPTPRTSRIVTDAPEEEITEITTTTELISMTKAVTTTPVPVTAPSAETDERVEISEGNYDTEFFKDDLFIGDSIMTGLSGFGFIPSENVFAKVGLNPESLFTTNVDSETALQKIISFQPRNVYIMLGTNGLAFMSGEYMADELGKFIDNVFSSGSSSNIIIITIPPVTQAHESAGNETMDDINAYNTLLEELALEKGVLFADVCSILKNNDGFFSDRFAEQDGLHFLGTAYKAMLSFLQNEIEYIR